MKVDRQTPRKKHESAAKGLAERLSLAPDGAGRCSEDNNQNGDACRALLCDMELEEEREKREHWWEIVGGFNAPRALAPCSG